MQAHSAGRQHALLRSSVMFERVTPLPFTTQTASLPITVKRRKPPTMIAVSSSISEGQILREAWIKVATLE